MSKETSKRHGLLRSGDLENEVVVAHVGEGHFPILTNGTVSLHGTLIEPNPASKRMARRFLFDAHNAAPRGLWTWRTVPGHNGQVGAPAKALLSA
jgi:hypothetical protein